MSETRVGGAYVDLYVNGGEKFQKDIEEAEKKLKEYIDLAIEITKKKKDLEAKMKETKKDKGKDSDEYRSLQKEYTEIIKQHKEVTDSAKKLNDELESMMKELSNNLSDELKKQEETAKNLSDASKDIANSTKEIEKSNTSSKSSSNPFKEQQKSIREMQKNLLEVNKTLEHGKQIQEKISEEQKKTNDLVEKNAKKRELLDDDKDKQIEELRKRLADKQAAEEHKTEQMKKRALDSMILEEERSAEHRKRILEEGTLEYMKTVETQKRVNAKYDAELNRTKNIELATEKQILETQEKEQQVAIKENNIRKNNAKIQNSELAAIKEEEKLQKNLAKYFKKGSNYYNTTSSSVIGLANKFDVLRTATIAFRTVLTSLSARKLYDFLIEPNAELEQHLVQFNTLLGSMENAQDMMDDIIKIAKKTPFETNDVVSAVEILSQYGQAQEDLIPKFKQLADLSRGNADNLNNIALAYGRIENSGKVTLRELNIMIRRGVPVMQALAESTGKTTAELYKMIRAGELTVGTFDEAIDYLTKNGGRFEGLVEEQGKTLQGRLSTLKDYVFFIGKDMGEGLFENFKGYINDIITEIERLESTGELEQITKEFGAVISAIVDNLANLVKLIYENKNVIDSILPTIISFTTSMKLAASAVELLGIKSKLASGLVSASMVVIGMAVGSLVKSYAEYSVLNQKISEETDKLLKANERSKKTYQTQSKSFEENAKNAHALTDELRQLMEVSNKNSVEKNRILEIVDELNELYPELNMKYSSERDELNKNIETMDNYIMKYKQYSEFRATQTVYEDLLVQQEQLKIQRDKELKDYEEALKRKQELEELYYSIEIGSEEYFDLGIYRYKELEDAYWESANTVKIHEQNLKDLDEAILNNTNLIDEYTKKLENSKNIEDEFNKTVVETVDTFDELKETIQKASDNIGKAFEAINDESSEYVKNVNDVVGAVDDLTDAMVKNNSESSFSVDEAMKLISSYPELATAIYQTADGYKFETEALNTLRQAKIEAANAAINMQINETKTAIAEINHRIRAMDLEREAIRQLMAEKAALQKEAFDLQKALIPFNKQLELASSTFGRDTGNKSKKDTETEDERKIRNLKFDYDMGLINAKQYYDGLEKIKNKYYAEGSKKWQQYTLEIKEGREKVDEEAKKLAEDEFKTTLESMQNQLDDEEHFDRLSKEQKVERLKEIRNYIKDSYDKRLIDYETYKEEYRQISRDIYSTEKDVLKESIDELNELRDKKYKAAVEQIEKYYEDIDKAQEAAEREQELKELRQTEQLYEGAVSRAGQEKLKDLQKDIKKLEDEKIKEELEAQREYHLENLDAKYKALEESQNEYFETVQGGIKTTAQIVGEYTSQIAGFFSQINEILNTTRGQSVQTSNSLTINQYISDAASNRAAIDMTQVTNTYGFLYK